MAPMVELRGRDCDLIQRQVHALLLEKIRGIGVSLDTFKLGQHPNMGRLICRVISRVFGK